MLLKRYRSYYGSLNLCHEINEIEYIVILQKKRYEI